jgi:xylan 1,4-beta-xylosidase
MLLSRNQFLVWTALAIAGVGMVELSLQVQSGPAAAAGRPVPQIGKALRYVNPLNIEANSKDGSPVGVSVGDATVVRDGDRYYMFASGGGPWVSQDMVTWMYAPLSPAGARVPVAPHVVKYDGVFYMTGNASPLYRSTNILGPYEEVGPWFDEMGNPIDLGNDGYWNSMTPVKKLRVFDPCIFVDSDNKPYVYMSFAATHGIWGAPLDPKHLNQLAAAPKTLFSFNDDHVWERSGNANERSHLAYIEGPWMFKRNSIYYLEYSASGTEWLTYATGVYTAKSPLGPFTYMHSNPLLRQTNGLVAGPGHGSVIQSSDGNYWQFYLTVLPNPPGGRRIGMDPIGFDAEGNMFIRGGIPTVTPQWAPGIVRDPVRDGDSGSVPLTLGKIRNLVASSNARGRDPAYALDDSNGTWWEPAEGDAQPSMTVDLLQIAPFDRPYTVDSSRIIFTAREPVDFGSGSAAAKFSGGPAFLYKIEGSLDSKEFTTLVDKTKNSVIRYSEFDEIPPTRCRFVRLTMTDWPRSAQQPLGISEFTVFGKYIDAETKPGSDRVPSIMLRD